MLDQLVIGSKASHDDFDASLKERAIHAPSKKSIKETVPFSNVTYDFSAINGEVYWEERVLEYVFEIIAFTPEEMESKKTAFSNWVMNTMSECIYDPFEPGWHYEGTFEDITYEDDESLHKTTITVTFSAYPYKIENGLTVYSFTLPAASSIRKAVANDSSHRITPTIITDAELTLNLGNVAYAISAGETKDDSFKLEPGANVLLIYNNTNADCALTIEFHREVF